MSKVEKEIKRVGSSIGAEIGRTRPEDILTVGATAVTRETLKKGAQEFGNAVGTLTGSRPLRKEMQAQAAQQRGLIDEQERMDEEARVRRRSMLRATLSERPNLFSILGSQQGAL